VSPYYQDSAVTIYCGSNLDVLPEIETADHIITDPPYGARTNKGARNNAGSESPITYAPLDVEDVGRLIPVFLGIAKRWVIVWYDIEGIGHLASCGGDSYIRAGFWRKPDATPQFTGDRPAMAGEACAIFHRAGKKKWNFGGHPAFWEVYTERERLGHPTPKPIKLLTALVTQFTDENETILDPFMGSGTTLRAAKDLGRKAIGIEIEERYCEIAAKRMQQEVLNLC
jgi:DNA modification methylase